MQALGNKIIFKKDERKEKVSSGGIVVLEGTEVDEFSPATIISVGKDITSLKPNDRVMMRNGVGVNFEQDGVEYHQCIEDDIDCIILE